MDTYRHSHEPTQAQKEAGNYRKTHRRVAGLDIAIENPAGSVRRGIDPGGHEWESRVLYDYGYIKGSLGADRDHVDCFIGLDASSDHAYIVTTMKPPAFKEPDEQKVMLQFGDEVSAVAAFLSAYDDPRFFGGVQAMPLDEFRRKVRAADGEMIKSTVPLVLVKGGNGSGWHGPQHGGTHMPSSAGLDTLENARHYWRYHYGGYVRHLEVHLSGRAPIPIKVRFDESNEHAFTTDAGGKEKTGERMFDEKRAKAMSRILQVIEHPKARARNYHADLMFEAPVGGEHYTVVLTWRDVAKLYEFHSAHFKTIDEVRRLLAHQDHRKNSGPLQKGGPLTVFAGLRGARPRVSLSGGYHPNGTSNGMPETIIPQPTHKSSPVLVLRGESAMDKIDLLKSHIEQYTRKDGTVVQAHDTKVQKHADRLAKMKPGEKVHYQNSVFRSEKFHVEKHGDDEYSLGGYWPEFFGGAGKKVSRKEMAAKLARMDGGTGYAKNERIHEFKPEGGLKEYLGPASSFSSVEARQAYEDSHRAPRG